MLIVDAPRHNELIRPLDPSAVTDERHYRWAWAWARLAPERYGGVCGFDDFAEFCRYGLAATVQDCGVFASGELRAFITLMAQDDGSCRVGIITPPRPRVRLLLRALAMLETAVLARFAVWWVYLPDNPAYDGTRRLARAYGATELAPTMWGQTRENYVQGAGCSSITG